MEKILSAEEFRKVWEQFDSEVLIMENYAKYLLEKQADYIKSKTYEVDIYNCGYSNIIRDTEITQASTEFIKNIEL